MSNPVTVEDIYELFRISQQEADRRAAEADRRMQKLERTVENTNRAVNALTTRWRRFVEELVRPGVARLFRAKGINVTRTFLRMRSELGNVPMEIDVFGVNGMSAIAVECKSRLSTDDVDQMCQRLGNLKQAFPEYSSYRIFGAVAGIEVDDNVGRYAYQKSLYVIKPSGDSVEIINDEKFQAIAW